MRLRKLKNSLRKNNRFPYLITDLINIKYITGFTGSYAYLLVDEKRSYFISDSRYEEYTRSILPKSIKFVSQEEDFFKTLKQVLKNAEREILYLEEHSLVLSTYLQLKKKLRGIKLLPGGDEVNSIRIIKDEDEIECLRKAAQITDRCVEHLKSIIKPGIIEWDVAVEVEYFYRKNGCRKSSFDTIVASGKGSSMPHYETSMMKKIEEGDVVLIDMGCEYNGYNSDLTRTMFLHSIDPYIEKIYNIVKKAQAKAVEFVKPGITVRQLDSIARDIISADGYAENFGHSLGHGFGLEIHELPAVKDSDFKLKKNMTITIEPGIYIPGKGGVRIEDMVLVTNNGYELLTKSSKDITVI